MSQTANSFTQLSKLIETEIQTSITEFVENVWDEVVLNPLHPRDTGTLQFSWKAIPYMGGGQGAAGDTFHPSIQEYNSPATRPDFSQYKRQWRSWILFNNQPYLMRVNDLPNKPYTGWIDAGYRRAVAKSK